MKRASGLVIAAAVVAGGAGAQTISAADPEGVAEALRALGWRAQLSTDAQGDPMIATAIEGVESTLFFYGCENGAACDALLFWAGFDLADGATMEQMNAWNADRLVGAAYLDAEGDPILQFFATTEGGMTRENFDDWVDWWAVALRDFKQHIGW